METDSERVIHTETEHKSTPKGTEHAALKEEQRKAAAAQAAVEDLQRRLAVVDHSFVDAVEALIATAAEGSLETAMEVYLSEIEGEEIGYEAIIEITVQTPGQLGDISIRGGGASGHGRYGLPNPYDQHQSLHPPSEEVDAWKRKVNDYHVQSDLIQYRKVTATTILELGRLLSPDSN